MDDLGKYVGWAFQFMVGAAVLAAVALIVIRGCAGNNGY